MAARQWSMAAEGSDLLAMALELQAEGTGDEEAVASLVEAAHGSATTLMSGCAYALSLARGMPYDSANQRTLRLLTAALQHAVHTSGEEPSEDRDSLLRHIVEVAGGAAMAPPAVASRIAELDADLETLRPASDNEAPASS